MSTHPWDFAAAREAASRASIAQRDAERFMADAAKKAAEAERAYRQALAQQIVREHAEGAAWTVAQDLARGDKTVANLRYERDVAEGVKEAAGQAAWRAAADRKDVGRFIEWSRRAAFDGVEESERAAA